MPTPRTDFLAQLAAVIGSRISSPEAEILRRRGYASEYTGAETAGDREETLSDAAAFVSDLREVFDAAPTAHLAHRTLAKDGRWALLSELEAARCACLGCNTGESWPLSLAVIEDPDSLYPTRVRVVFDGRMSLQAIMRGLRAAWPELRGKGWVRRTRPLGARGLDLVRFVCREVAPQMSWRRRCEAWNRSRPKPWRYAEVRAFNSDFRRAEKSLTGRTHGLAWFYDIDARVRGDGLLSDLIELAEQMQGVLEQAEHVLADARDAATSDDPTAGGRVPAAESLLETARDTSALFDSRVTERRQRLMGDACSSRA